MEVQKVLRKDEVLAVIGQLFDDLQEEGTPRVEKTKTDFKVTGYWCGPVLRFDVKPNR
jgi:hypothetical protein